MDSIRLSNIEFGLKHSTHKNQAGLSDDLESVEDTYDLVEVLHKHKNDPVSVIQDCVKEIFIVNYELQDQNIKVFHSTISKCDFLESLKLHYCGNSVNLKKFLDSLKNINCQIEKISIWGMCKLVQYFETLVMVMRKSKTKTLEIQAVQLKSEDLTEMRNVLVKHSSNKMLDLQLENLDLSYNRDMSPEDFSICGNIVKLLPVTNVRMFDCSLTDEKVEKLKSSLEEKQVSEQWCRFSSSVHSYSKKFKESSAITFHYEKDFDENGIIYWIGTNWRTALKWVNPAIHNLVHITSSEGRGLPYGKLEEVLSRDPAPLNCHTSNSKTAWICIDFRLWIIPSAYTLRHSRGYVNSALRNWLFQASKDGQTWITLYNHSNDTSLNEPGSTATWNITSHVGEKQGWRHFRLQQSGQTARKRTHYLSMSGLEIYGTVTGACEQLNSLDISCNSEITKKGFFTIGKITETSGLQNLTISDCEMTSQKLESLQEAIPERRKLNKLDVSYNDTLGAEGMSTLGSFVIKYEVEDVSLASCKLNEKLMESFLSSAQQSKLGNHMQIQQLNISHNRSIGRGIIHIARMINNGTLKRVNMSECMLSKNNVKAFCDNIQKPIQALNLSDSDRLVTIDYIEAICEVIPHISEELVLKFHSLTSACRSLLLDKLNSLKHSETRIILGNGDILNKRDTKAQTEKK